MVQIAVIGDVHDMQVRLTRVLERIASDPPDLALLVGDVGRDPPWNEPQRETEREDHDESIRRVVARVRSRLGCPVAFVPGNHDLRKTATDIDGCNCDGRIVEVAGLRIAGFGGAGPGRFGFPYEWDEPEADVALRALLDDASPPDILISHTPPARTGLDRTSRGEHVGSESVRRWTAIARPKLVVCGHIHEAWGVERIEGVPCLNAGALGEPFGAEIVWLVRWSPEGPEGIRSFHVSPDGETSTRVWTLQPAS
jgi:Icc-related predicted phosphoesterase